MEFELVVAGPNGTRVLDVSEVVTGPGQMTLGDDEFIVEFEIDKMPNRSGDAYLRMTPRTEMDIAARSRSSSDTADDGSIGTSCSCLPGAVAHGCPIPDAEHAPLRFHC